MRIKFSKVVPTTSPSNLIDDFLNYPQKLFYLAKIWEEADLYINDFIIKFRLFELFCRQWNSDESKNLSEKIKKMNCLWEAYFLSNFYKNTIPFLSVIN